MSTWLTEARSRSVEWEELPALQHAVLRRHVPHASYQIAHDLVREARARIDSLPGAGGPVWTETMPAGLDPLIPSAPLQETFIEGLAAREIVEPDVFRHFFDRPVTR